MSQINQGTQRIAWKYQTPLQATYLNTLIAGFSSPGLLTRPKLTVQQLPSGMNVTIDPFSLLIVPIDPASDPDTQTVDENGEDVSLSLVKITTTKSYPIQMPTTAVAIGFQYSFAEIELAAIMRANLKERNDNFYRRTILLQSFRIISESTKALFGFVNKDKKNAFWNKLTLSFDLSLFSQDVEEIKAGVNDLSKNVINKINRDIASHYDWDALAVESSYISIKDEDLICQNLSKYGYVIERVSKISNKLLGSFINSINLPKHPSGSAVDRVIPSDLVWLFEKSILKPQLIEVIAGRGDIAARAV